MSYECGGGNCKPFKRVQTQSCGAPMCGNGGGDGGGNGNGNGNGDGDGNGNGCGCGCSCCTASPGSSGGDPSARLLHSATPQVPGTKAFSPSVNPVNGCLTLALAPPSGGPYDPRLKFTYNSRSAAAAIQYGSGVSDL